MVKVDYKTLEKVKKMNKRQLSVFINEIYNMGVDTGYDKCIKDDNRFDWCFIEASIKSTEGVGEKTLEKIKNNVYKLLYRERDYELK